MFVSLSLSIKGNKYKIMKRMVARGSPPMGVNENRIGVRKG